MPVNTTGHAVSQNPLTPFAFYEFYTVIVILSLSFSVSASVKVS